MPGWVLTTAVIAGWDVYAKLTGKEMMSTTWRRWLGEPAPRLACTLAWSGLTGHLFYRALSSPKERFE